MVDQGKEKQHPCGPVDEDIRVGTFRPRGCISHLAQKRREFVFALMAYGGTEKEQERPMRQELADAVNVQERQQRSNGEGRKGVMGRTENELVQKSSAGSMPRYENDGKEVTNIFLSPRSGAQG